MLKKNKEQELHKIKFRQWNELSNCNWLKFKLDADIDMFPVRMDAQESVAREICKGCPTQVECLILALTSKENYGVWGGLSEEQRKQISDKIYNDFIELPSDIWSEALGREIKYHAEIVVDEFNEMHDVKIQDIENIIDLRKNILQSMERD